MGNWGQIFPFSHILIGNWENWKYQLMSQTHISSSNLLNHASQLRSQLKPQIYGSDLRHNLRSQSHISDLSRIFPFSNFPVENWENWTIRPDFPNFQFSHVKFSNGKIGKLENGKITLLDQRSFHYVILYYFYMFTSLDHPEYLSGV